MRHFFREWAGRRGVGRSGGGWEAGRWVKPSNGTEKSCCVLSKAQKQPQCTCQDKMVVGSSLTPHAALLVRPIAPYISQWTVMDLHGQINAACESKPGHPQPCHWSVWIVLECGFHVKL